MNEMADDEKAQKHSKRKRENARASRERKRKAPDDLKAFERKERRHFYNMAKSKNSAGRTTMIDSFVKGCIGVREEKLSKWILDHVRVDTCVRSTVDDNIIKEKSKTRAVVVEPSEVTRSDARRWVSGYRPTNSINETVTGSVLSVP